MSRKHVCCTCRTLVINEPHYLNVIIKEDTCEVLQIHQYATEKERDEGFLLLRKSSTQVHKALYQTENFVLLTSIDDCPCSSAGVHFFNPIFDLF